MTTFLPNHQSINHPEANRTTCRKNPKYGKPPKVSEYGSVFEPVAESWRVVRMFGRKYICPAKHM
jgi:hypothetical protein